MRTLIIALMALQAAWAQPTFNVGAELYAGASDIPGYRSFFHGFWAGRETAYPSLVYMRAEVNGWTAYGSLGLGRVEDVASARQLVEGYLRAPLSANTGLTAGRFWIPFGLQEWQYESKPGAMLDASMGEAKVSIALVQNEALRRGNAYARAEWSPTDSATLGVSAGWGDGISYGTSHNQIAGADALIALGPIALSGEAVRLSGAPAFWFGFGQAEYTGLGDVRPFVALYGWNDKSAEIGSGSVTVAGLRFQANEWLLIEGGRSFAAGQANWWAQASIVFER